MPASSFVELRFKKAITIHMPPQHSDHWSGLPLGGGDAPLDPALLEHTEADSMRLSHAMAQCLV